MSEFSILPGLKEPASLKNLSSDELEILAREIREYIIEIVNKNGGHLASNLGTVELTLALHKSFNSPYDKIIWDVGHQCYTHKLLTGRYEEFKTLRQTGGMSGFPKRKESIHEIMNTGHASTSVSAALGVQVGELLSEGKGGRSIAVVGDGSLTGGMALEALNHAGHLGKKLIVILNDNKMSISKNVGAISSYMSRLASSGSYHKFRNIIDRIITIIPFAGKAILAFVYRLKRGVKGVVYKENIFTDLGFQYIGPINGHDIEAMEKVFVSVKEINKPVVIHIATIKGKGLPVAEDDPVGFHGVAPLSPRQKKPENKIDPLKLTEAYGEALVKCAEKDKKIVAITAAMTKGTGLKPFSEKFRERFFDVGIAEAHAVTFSAGLAIGGRKPFLSVYSTFMQRAVDQVIHDVAIPHLPVTIVMDRAGLVPADGASHQGLYDISLFKTVPDLTFLSPVNRSEMDQAVRLACETKGPFMIRYSKENCFRETVALSESFVKGRGVFLRKNKEEGDKILLMSLGSLLFEVEKCADLLEEQNICADIYNMRFIAPLDIDYLFDLVSPYTLVILCEDGVKTGGLGEQIAAKMFENNKTCHFRYFGAPDKFLDQATRGELIRECGLDGESLMKKIMTIKKNVRFAEVAK